MKNNEICEEAFYLSGIVRSGTTWAGQVIGSSRNIRYYHEPFQPHRNHKGNPFKEFFQYIPLSVKPEDFSELDNYVNRLLNFDVRGLYDIGDIRNSRKLNYIYHPINRLRSKLAGLTPFIKDPCSLLISEWLYHYYKFKVIIVVRHPAAFVSSSRKANWHYGMHTFLEQKDLMENYLVDFKDLMEEEVKKETVEFSVENSVLFWRILTHVMIRWQKKYKDKWYYCRHEDLSKAPNEEFEKLFQFLKRPLGSEVSKFIQKTTSVKRGKESRLLRDTQSLIWKWKEVLSLGEIEYIKQNAKAEWSHFYKEKDW